MRLLLGDCLIESDKIESGSVDLILTDLPYGNMQGVDFDDMPHGKKINKNQKIFWDDLLPIKKVFEICNRILRKNGKAIFTAQGDFTFKLHKEQLPNLPFNHKMIWDKQQFANCLLVNKAPLNYYEDILVFSKKHNTYEEHYLLDYSLKLRNYTNYSRSYFKGKLGHIRYIHLMEISKKRNQGNLCTKEVYSELINTFNIDKMQGFKEYEELKELNQNFKNNFSSTFNLWEGNKYKSNILKYKKDYDGHHPTQKPVLLLEDLIKTFSNEGDTVVDLTMGSGSTGVACKNTNRDFIGIEREKNIWKLQLLVFNMKKIILTTKKKENEQK